MPWVCCPAAVRAAAPRLASGEMDHAHYCLQVRTSIYDRYLLLLTSYSWAWPSVGGRGGDQRMPIHRQRFSAAIIRRLLIFIVANCAFYEAINDFFIRPVISWEIHQTRRRTVDPSSQNGGRKPEGCTQCWILKWKTKYYSNPKSTHL